MLTTGPAAIVSPVSSWREITIADRSGEMHIFLDPEGDHIVTKFIVGRDGQRFETTLPHGAWAWDRAVGRAQRAMVFL